MKDQRPTDVILVFDTEDFVTPEAFDAQRWWAEELTDRGLRGCFQCVGELVRRLRRSGRDDVLAALALHEIGYHTRLHSLPPLHPTSLVDSSLEEGVAWVLRHESAGVAELCEAFGRVPVTYAEPGNAWTPATLLAMAALGIRVWAGMPGPLSGWWYCGLLAKDFDLDLEDFYDEDGAEAESRFTAALDRELRRERDDGAVVLGAHPTRLVTSAFWDAPLHGGAEVALEDLPPAPLRSASRVRALKDRVRRWLDRIAEDPDIRVIDYATYWLERAGSRRDLPALLAECGLPPREPGALPLRAPGPESPELVEGRSPLRYDWPVFPGDFDGAPLFDQARRLLWTARRASTAAGRAA